MKILEITTTMSVSTVILLSGFILLFLLILIRSLFKAEENKKVKKFIVRIVSFPLIVKEITKTKITLSTENLLSNSKELLSDYIEFCGEEGKYPIKVTAEKIDEFGKYYYYIDLIELLSRNKGEYTFRFISIDKIEPYIEVV